ncbi:MAG: hypothetical protein ABIC40_00465, partial [bacterium]
YFENWEHDFVKFRMATKDYKMAQPMCKLLSEALGTQKVNIIRQIPATNLIFRRSSRAAKLKFNTRKAIIEAKPYLERLILKVNPIVILIIRSAYKEFCDYYCSCVNHEFDSVIKSPCGSNPACIYSSATAFPDILKREVRLLSIGHPSTFGYRADWSKVISSVRNELVQIGLNPIEETPYLTRLDDIPGYGSIV